jgi:hypothetical protein
MAWREAWCACDSLHGCAVRLNSTSTGCLDRLGVFFFPSTTTLNLLFSWRHGAVLATGNMPPSTPYARGFAMWPNGRANQPSNGTQVYLVWVMVVFIPCAQLPQRLLRSLLSWNGGGAHAAAFSGFCCYVAQCCEAASACRMNHARCLFGFPAVWSAVY